MTIASKKPCILIKVTLSCSIAYLSLEMMHQVQKQEITPPTQKKQKTKYKMHR